MTLPRGRSALVTTTVLATFAYVAVSAYAADKVTRPRRRPFEHTPGEHGLVYETVSFRSRVDALRLEGWLMPAADIGRPAVVFVHGRGGDRQSELYGGVLELAAELVRRGHTVLTFDLRGSGRSDGRRFTLGGQEVRDVGGAIDFLRGRGLTVNGIVLYGFSMGAATVLLAAPAEADVRAVVADSSYADLPDVLANELPRRTGLPRAFTPGIVACARVMTRTNPALIRPVAAARALAARDVPLLVIHGEADEMIALAHAHRLVDSYGPAARSLYVPGGTHAMAQKADPARYLETILDFLSL